LDKKKVEVHLLVFRVTTSSLGLACGYQNLILKTEGLYTAETFLYVYQNWYTSSYPIEILYES